ncbi:hypothetical protein PV327_009673 [Microctonus hyperodae]|uniref:C2H2-type domain-containing protein n=1 Tax=Microctonus hyperodae TaxID=165561 RepID=A0AA39F0J0_MICHY|nr:hypothetical protein PV327_009673 [Microctonus hyperodae]
MESSAIGIGRLDCYEDMFKEITRKLYGDDPDHRTSSVQNEFETSVSYKTEDDTGHGTDSDDGQWICEDESLKGTDGSRIAAYHAGKSMWKCYECGDCMSGSPRDIAEHFIELHSSRIIGDDSRHRNSLSRKDYLHTNDPKLEDIVSYLERVRDRAERGAPPLRRTQETQTIPAALLPATTTFLLQELPSTPPQHLHSSPTMMSTSGTTLSSSKRYTCPYCPYGTDRRDLYTRHENIHREEKPFHCYVCYKPFNRADHVKKHFLRMHREHTYELSRIRRSPGTVNNSDIKSHQQQDNNGTTINGNNNHHTNYTTNYNNNKNYQLQTSQASTVPGPPTLYQSPTTTLSSVVGNMQDNNCGNRRINSTGCNSKSHLKAGSKGGLERRYTCCYCSWSGVDNWCLKRHLNTHLKPFACALCEYKAARAERLATHVLKVHNKRQCSRCSFLGEDIAQLQLHQLHVHRINNAVNSGGAGSGNGASVSAPTSSAQQGSLHSPTTATTAPTSASSCNRPDQSLHSVGGGRPPPGPPVFPTAASAVISQPTTILGNALTNGRNRSRKQSEPRKVLTNQCESEEDDDNFYVNNSDLNLIDTDVSKSKCENRYLRCYLCPNNASARALTRKPYHTKASLTLHTLWRHFLKTKKRQHNPIKLSIKYIDNINHQQQNEQRQHNTTRINI